METIKDYQMKFGGRKMLKLIKLELFKSKNILIYFFSIIFLTEIIFLIGYALDKEILIAITTFLLSLMAVVSVVAIIIYSVILYLPDISKKPGYMLFSTPNSAYKILGSKIIVTLIVGFLLFILFSLLGVFDIYLLTKDIDTSEFTVESIFKSIIDALSEEPVGITLFLASTLSQFVSNIAIIYFSITLTYTFLSNLKFKNFIAFLVFVAVNVAISIIKFVIQSAMSLTGAFEFNTDLYNSSNPFDLKFNVDFMLVPLIVTTVIGLGMYFASAWMVEKKLNL
jgi:ABC-2 type transport system permease protein